MNREIKFRAWDKDFEGWHDIRNIHIGTGQLEWDTGFSEKMTDKEREAIVLMQYTGLKDKNGKEIYEGDVVKADFPEMVNEEPDMHGPELYHREVVVAEKKEVLGEVRIRPVGGTGMIVRKINILKDNNDRRKREEIMKNTKIGRFLKIRQNKDEVIGNIYENPELLEEDNEN